MRADVPEPLANELEQLARQEPPAAEPQTPPVHADRYRALAGGRVEFGPAFAFPEALPASGEIAPIEDEARLQHMFRGWLPGDIAAGRGPVRAVLADGEPVSVCFCARRTEVAAEAGVDTAAPFRGRGYAPRVTSAWAAAIRASGRIPLYSTSWSNQASLAVVHKLRLIPYASDWTLTELPPDTAVSRPSAM